MNELAGKTVVVLVDQAYQEMEVWYPIYRLLDAGAKVITAGPEAGAKVLSKLGYPVTADISYAGLATLAADGVIAPGGWAPDYIRRSPAAVEFVARMNREGKLIAAICHGPWVLCSADVLRGKRATSFIAVKTDVVNAGAAWEDSETVRDGTLVTARKPEDLPAFVRACIDVLRGQ